MQFIFTKLGSTLLVIALIAFGYFLFTAIGDTTINVTLKTNPTLENGLVGHWTFDGKDTDWGSNTVTDASGQGNTGTITNMSTTTSPTFGVLGQALSFDGEDDYVDIDDSSGVFNVGTNNFSLSLWIEFPMTGDNQGGILSKGKSGAAEANTWGLWRWSTNPDRVRFRTTLAAGGNDADLFSGFKGNGWHHIVVVRDSPTTYTMYIDGVFEVSDTASEAGNFTSEIPLRLARAGPSNASYVGATIDETRFYNRALSAEEVKRLYELGGTTHVNVTLPSIQDGLVGHWTFDGKDTDWGSNTVTDASGQGNTGTITNMSTTTSPTFGVLGQAFEFDGVDDEVNMTYDTSLDLPNSGGTLSLWAYPTDPMGQNNSSSLIHRPTHSNPAADGNWKFMIHQSGPTDPHYLRIHLGSTNDVDAVSDTVNAVSENVWQLLTVTWDTNTIKFYVDGNQGSSITRTKTITYSASLPVYIGRTNASTNAKFFNGIIDDVRIYNRALSGEEIKRLYNMGK